MYYQVKLRLLPFTTFRALIFNFNFLLPFPSARQIHCLASVKPRGYNPPSSHSQISWFTGEGGATHGE